MMRLVCLERDCGEDGRRFSAAQASAVIAARAGPFVVAHALQAVQLAQVGDEEEIKEV